MDRVLRPGGYWILSGPPINWKQHWKGWERSQEDLKQEQDSIENAARSLCWKKVTEKGDFSIWQKPINHIECKKLKRVHKSPPICTKAVQPDSAWYTVSTPPKSSKSIYVLLKNLNHEFPTRNQRQMSHSGMIHFNIIHVVPLTGIKN